MPANYAPLITQWAALPGGDTTAQKLAAINAMTVVGPNVDVPLSSVIAYLSLSGKLAGLLAYAASPPSGANVAAVVAAKELAALISSPNAPDFGTSDPTVLETLTAFLAYLVADTANTGVTSADQTAILALAVGAPIPWWQADGLTSPVSEGDLNSPVLLAANNGQGLS